MADEPTSPAASTPDPRAHRGWSQIDARLSRFRHLLRHLFTSPPHLALTMSHRAGGKIIACSCGKVW